jgi:proton-translocating NADH-quinone oxidoreductase chain N
VAFELMSIASFALVAFDRDRWEPIEAGTKYIIMSGAGSALALVGISLVYATAGTTDLSAIRASLAATSDTQGTVPVLALMLMIVGFGVKAAMAPLHTWLPDAHSAAPSGISAMLSGVVIQAGLITIVKSTMPFLRGGPFGDAHINAMPEVHVGLAIAVIAVLTMTTGNLMALRQKDLKRMLAYSSVAQMGYMLMGFGLWLYAPAVAEVGLWGGLFHILTHAFMKGGAFLVAGAIIYSIGTRDMHEMRGMGRHNLVLGICFAIFAFSLSGMPPFSGFISELLLVRGGVDIAVAGVGIGKWGLVFAAAIIINSVISLGYYLPAINKLLFAKNMTPLAKKAKPLPWSMTVPIVIMAAITLLFGLFPDYGLMLVEPAVVGLQDLAGLNPGTGGV